MDSSQGERVVRVWEEIGQPIVMDEVNREGLEWGENRVEGRRYGGKKKGTYVII